MAFAKVLKAFSSARWGNSTAGDTIEGNESVLAEMATHGMVELIKEKKPQSQTGKTEQSLSVPAVQVSPEPTFKKRKGRKQKQSQSTPPLN